MHPASIKRTDSENLRITWNDGSGTTLSLRTLRDHCPCAGCKGETVLLRSYVPPAPDTTIPGRYTLVNIQTVGSYAMQPIWGDGHETGIYTWEYLRQLAEERETP